MKKLILALLTILFVSPAMMAENIGVPAESEDVMLQAFYWDSYKTATNGNSKYGCTKWGILAMDSTLITDNFDVVWFPPSAKGNGGAGKGGVGYTHVQLSNQESDWGQRSTLEKLIAALHRGGTKVLADIVINHRGNCSNWCDFCPDDFGEGYGSFQLTQEHICQNDEGFTDSRSTCYGAPSSERGAADTGSNFDGARDLDHSNSYVQDWAKAYVRWMIDVMKYDGFRYDMTLGYHGQYLSMYNEASQPYISVSELWDGINRQKQHLEETNYNTMIFDFPQKYLLNNAIVKGSYSLLKRNNSSFRGQGLERYAVTFVDNHDTFERDGYGDNQFGGQYCDLSTATVKANVLQAYAYILSMPGIPCVFYPHWTTYRQEINQMIRIRKLAGIHSESKVLEETSGGYSYSGTIQGHHRKLIVRVGKNRDTVTPVGYWKIMEGDHYSLFIESGEGIEELNEETSSNDRVKILENGRLMIRVGEKLYDATGRLVR